MADIMKHVGKYGDKPCVVVFRHLPEEADQALIVVSDSLEGQLHDDIMWPDIKLKAIKFDPFLNVDINKYREIILSTFNKT